MIRLLYQYIVLSSIKKLQHDRSVNAVYYLLQGKQSIQTIQDAHLYGLNSYYRIYKQLSKEHFLQTIEKFEKEHYLDRNIEDEKMFLTTKANNWLEDNHIIEWYGNGILYHNVEDSFFRRLLLLIQVWTNAQKKERSYIPIIEDPEIKLWVKQYFQLTKHTIPNSLQKLYDELIELFSKITNQTYIEIFVQQLTGYQQIGLAKVQLAKKYKLAIEDIDLITTNMIHYILDTVMQYPHQFELLIQLTKDISKRTQLTHSASKTYFYIKKGFTLEQIAAQRKLKINTIYDHIVELAIVEEDFPWRNYVSNEVFENIVHAVQQVGSYTLKEIKSFVPESISYFQIRLVLAKYQTTIN